MLKSICTGAFAASLLIGLVVFTAQPANAWHHHYRHFHHHHRRFHMTTINTSSYGTYPNIQYFQRNGHVWAKNLDAGNTYLVR